MVSIQLAVHGFRINVSLISFKVLFIELLQKYRNTQFHMTLNLFQIPVGNYSGHKKSIVSRTDIDGNNKALQYFIYFEKLLKHLRPYHTISKNYWLKRLERLALYWNVWSN